jgi:hypothetical protein
MCTVLLPPGVSPIAGNKYIILNKKDTLSLINAKSMEANSCSTIHEISVLNDQTVHKNLVIFPNLSPLPKKRYPHPELTSKAHCNKEIHKLHRNTHSYVTLHKSQPK